MKARFLKHLATYLVVLSLLPLTGCFEVISKPDPEGPPPIPEVSNILLGLLNSEEKQEIKGQDFPSPSYIPLTDLVTPAGLRLNLRYALLGTSLVEALKLSRDRSMLDRLFELVQWSDQKKVRSEALVAVGSFSDPKDEKYMSVALTDQDTGIRAAGIEALQLWRLEPAKALLKQQVSPPWSPTLKIFAAQALLSMGDQSALKELYDGLDNRSWIIRAMSARYLGDYAPAEEYQRLFTAMNNESQNDYVIAETAIAALKLASKAKSSQTVAYSPYDKGWRENDEVKYSVGRDNTVDVEPMIIIPPRKRIPNSVVIAQSINQKLLFLLQNRLGIQLSEADQNDPNFQDLGKFLTPTGIALQTRYRNLSVVVTEGLAGTNDPFLRAQLSKLAETSTNDVARASAVLSLGYNGSSEDFLVIQRALTSSNNTVRFAGMEAAVAGKYEEAVPELLTIATTDPIPAFRMYAVQLLLQTEQPAAKNFLLSSLASNDWVARAMAFWYLGRYGTTDDFMNALNRFSGEDNPFVLAELALATQRLRP